jgi:hypothetical protein
VRSIQESEVKDVLKRMKGGKAMGPDGIPMEVWRTHGDVAIVCLNKLFTLSSDRTRCLMSGGRAF